jgi:hypothetical protein
MKKWNYIGLLALLLLGVPVLLQAQEEPKNWAINGYVKNLQNIFFIEGQSFQDNLIHNRLNFKWYVDEHFTFKADLRSRVFFGDLVKATPNYGDLVDNVNNDYFDLSLLLLNEDDFVIHTMLDRLYLEYVQDNWEVRLGRQRVNWGISTVWNPNDIFNAFAFTDFDYEERPGSDALRVKYYTGFASSIEVVAKAFDTWDEAVIAGLYKGNKGSYDYQILAGFMEQDVALGVGWAGNIKNASFKGEATYFWATQPNRPSSFAATIGVDYSFSNSLYINSGFLYNDRGSTSASVSNLFDFELSAKNLYPYRYALFFQTSYPFTPLLNGSIATIYSPGEAHAMFVNPVVTYSIRENWDLDLIGQIVLNQEENYQSPIQAVFLRLKWSY